MQNYTPLSDDAFDLREDDEPIMGTPESVATRLSKIGAGGPDDLPNWVLKEFSDTLAPAITDVLNQSFRESKVARIWRQAGISHHAPAAKGTSFEDFNKDLRPTSQSNFHVVQSRRKLAKLL